MCDCFFATDLHGRPDRYEKLFAAVEEQRPAILFLGGDLLPCYLAAPRSGGPVREDFVNNYLIAKFQLLKKKLAGHYPRVFVILGNDDPRFEEASILGGEKAGVWRYLHNRRVAYGDFTFRGYAFVPPTPFLLKDWERYDVSRYVDPGCIPPTLGNRTVPVPADEAEYATIKEDLKDMTGSADLSKSVFLFHAPPYRTSLDRADLDGKMFDHAPLDVNVGSIAVKRFIEERQPYITLHGHVHESCRLTGSWMEKTGRTFSFSAAHDGEELAIVKFKLSDPRGAERALL